MSSPKQTRPNTALIGLLSLSVLVIAIAFRTVISDTAPVCRVIPEDAAWPTQADWDSLNKTVNGRLIATVPRAAVCHKVFSGHPNLAFDQEKCNALRDTWFFAETHLSSSSSPMAYAFGNDSCNPFTEPDAPCDIGYHVNYAINVTSAADIQSAIAFVKKHNIRLVIRNTGHDYLGKSTGAHSLSIWTHYLKDISLVENYPSEVYSGPAIKMGAGIQTGEAYSFANANNLMVAGGNCATVGIAGGYTQGGGHGPLASKLGLAADQVLEWQVVTADGNLITSSPSENPDLYWALRGGGGSTFGVVWSMTVKAHPDTHVSTAHFRLFNDGTNGDAIYDVLQTFLTNLPDIVDHGVLASWILAPFGFILSYAFAPGLQKDELDRLLRPTTNKMDQLQLESGYASSEHASFLTAYNSLNDAWNVSDYNMGGRLIPRSLVERDVDAVLDVLRYIGERAIISGVAFNLQNGVLDPSEVAANPYLRQSLFSLVLGTPVDYSSSLANKAAQNQITNEFLPRVARIIPDGGAYLNEADFQDPDFKALFYGKHYEGLVEIKSKYDPLGIFYAQTGVGSDQWLQNSDGRLCKVV